MSQHSAQGLFGLKVETLDFLTDRSVETRAVVSGPILAQSPCQRILPIARWPLNGGTRMSRDLSIKLSSK